MLNWLQLLGGKNDDTGFVLTSGPDGSIYLGGETKLGAWDGHTNQGKADGFVARYDSNGRRSWTRWYATDQDDQVRGLTVGVDGSIYVSGGTLNGMDGNASFSSVGASDGFVSRIGPTGSKLWTQQVGGNSWDLARALGRAPDGSAIYVIGYSASPNFPSLSQLTPLPSGEGTPDAFVLRINPDKTIQWATRLGFGRDDWGMNIAVGADGFVYATGFSGSANEASQAFLAKLNPQNGTTVWKKLIGTTQNDYAESIRFSKDGFLYVLLSTDGNLDGKINQGNRDVAVQKYDLDGNRVWTVLHGSPAKEEGRNLTIDNDGNIYITGHTSGDLGGQKNNGGEDAFITKITPTGQVEWTKLLGTAGNDVGWDVTTTVEGDLIVTGLTNGNLEGQTSNGGQDIFLASFKILPTPALPTVTFTLNRERIQENSYDSLIYTFTRSGPLDAPLLIQYSLTGSTDETDYIG
ncbi:MAG: SBBP repeat-containing protein, partial [Cyanobacteriota bacterium]|nr:SBBP repeat-containing protein [Cyanobacteriota bacterium]